MAARTNESEPLLEADNLEDEANVRIQPNIDTSAREAYCEPGIKGLLSSRYVVFCAAFAALAGLLFGYDQGVISIILVEKQFLDRFGQVRDDAPGAGFWKGFLTAMIELGALIGAFSQGWIADRMSRKFSIMTAAGIFVVGSILQTISLTFITLAFARFVGGLGIGALSMAAPLYISETSPPEIRGSLLVLEELSIVSGIVIAFILTYITRHIESEWAWRLPFLLQIGPGLLLGIGVYSLPFSPRWLVAQGRNDEALLALSRLRQLSTRDSRVLLEWCDIKTEVACHQQFSMRKHPELYASKDTAAWKFELAAWTDLFQDGYWRRTNIGVGIMFFQQFCGINALIYYGPTMLKRLGLNYDSQLLMSGFINVAQLLGVLSSIWSMDRIGRRPLLLWGSLLMFSCHFVIAILVGSFSKDLQAHATQGWLCVFLLMTYMAVFGASWGPVPWALPSEIFPSHLRAKGVAIASCSNWLNNLIIGLITPPLVQNTGFGAYLFFAAFCLLNLGWVYVYVPETAGKTLEQIDDLFGASHIDDGDRQARTRLQQQHVASAFSSQNS